MKIKNDIKIRFWGKKLKKKQGFKTKYIAIKKIEDQIKYNQ
jgi:hypothetical protein